MSVPPATSRQPPLRSLMAEFTAPEPLLAAAQAARRAGYQHLEAYAPFPVEGLDEAIGFRSRAVQGLTLAAGLLGGIFGYGLQYWVNVWAYPLNIGGRPLNSVPSFIPVTFEMTILLAALTAAFGMLALNGLPRLNHPVFNVPAFVQGATRDRFFLEIEARDGRFDRVATRAFLEAQGAMEVHDVLAD